MSLCKGAKRIICGLQTLNLRIVILRFAIDLFKSDKLNNVMEIFKNVGYRILTLLWTFYWCLHFKGRNLYINNQIKCKQAKRLLA